MNLAFVQHPWHLLKSYLALTIKMYYKSLDMRLIGSNLRATEQNEIVTSNLLVNKQMGDGNED